MRRTLRPLVLLLAVALATGCTELKRRAYASGDRDEWQQPERVIESLGLAPGNSVADLGAGGGYFTFRLADAVGAQGKVLAVDVDEDMLEALAVDASEQGYSNVEIVVAAPDDPRLAPASLDLLFSSNTYHHIEDRQAYFARVREALRSGGRVAIVEYKREGFMQSVMGHATDGDLIRGEMEAAGYRLDAEHAFLEKQYFLVFTPEPG